METYRLLLESMCKRIRLGLNLYGVSMNSDIVKVKKLLKLDLFQLCRIDPEKLQYGTTGVQIGPTQYSTERLKLITEKHGVEDIWGCHFKGGQAVFLLNPVASINGDEWDGNYEIEFFLSKETNDHVPARKLYEQDLADFIHFIGRKND